MTTAGRVGDYLDHILSAIERIERYTSELDEAAFLESELVQDAVIRNIEVMGEASGKVMRSFPDFAAQNGGIPWLVMYTMRNRVSHGYDSVDIEVVWKTIRGDLPGLKTQIQLVRALTRLDLSP